MLGNSGWAFETEVASNVTNTGRETILTLTFLNIIQNLLLSLRQVYSYPYKCMGIALSSIKIRSVVGIGSC